MKAQGSGFRSTSMRVNFTTRTSPVSEGSAAGGGAFRAFSWPASAASAPPAEKARTAAAKPPTAQRRITPPLALKLAERRRQIVTVLAAAWTPSRPAQPAALEAAG